jgi:MFS family permease
LLLSEASNEFALPNSPIHLSWLYYLKGSVIESANLIRRSSFTSWSAAAEGEGERMSGSEFVWGAVLVACGIFIAVYGSLLFRFVLAVLGFAVGFGGAFLVLSDQSTATRILVGIAVGGIAAALLFALIRVGLYIAGGVLGLVVAVIVSGLFGWLDNGVGWTAGILLIAGGGLGGFFGNRLGDWIVILATAGAGALLVTNGVLVWFKDEYSSDLTGDPTTNLDKSEVLVMFLIVFAIAFLSQLNSTKLRDRLYRPRAA